MNRPLRYGFRVSRDRNPGYVAVDFFIGHNEGARPNCGSILVDPEDWAEVRLALVAGGFDEVGKRACAKCHEDIDALCSHPRSTVPLPLTPYRLHPRFDGDTDVCYEFSHAFEEAGVTA